MIQAVVFDMDGLLVDTEPCWQQARVDLARQVGKEWTADDHRTVMGVSTQEWVDIMIRRLDLDMPPEEVQARVIERLAALYRENIPFLPGSIEAVDLAAGHYPTALASGSHRSLIDTVVADPRLVGKFHVVLSADEVGAGKPAPDIYLATAARLGVAPERCVCLEDSGNGILSGKAAGMKVIAVPTPGHPPDADILALADVTLPSLTAFSLQTLKEL